MLNYEVLNVFIYLEREDLYLLARLLRLRRVRRAQVEIRGLEPLTLPIAIGMLSAILSYQPLNIFFTFLLFNFHFSSRRFSFTLKFFGVD